MCDQLSILNVPLHPRGRVDFHDGSFCHLLPVDSFESRALEAISGPELPYLRTRERRCFDVHHDFGMGDEAFKRNRAGVLVEN